MLIKKLKSLYYFFSKRRQTLHLDYPVELKPRFVHDSNKTRRLLYSIIQKNRYEIFCRLKKILFYKEVFDNLNFSIDEKNSDQPVWDNKFLPGLDIIILYGFVALIKPKKYIEIGSGNSTKVVRKSVDENNLDTKITSIDPYPRADINHLADAIIRMPIQDLKDYSMFEELDAGDILFIDNSHRVLPNSDATVCFLEILPLLKSGVIVQFHDIYLPYDYPQFMCDRAYSEQYVLAAFIIANPEKYKIIMPNYFVSEDKELSQILNPIWSNKKLDLVEKHGGSFWIEIQ